MPLVEVDESLDSPRCTERLYKTTATSTTKRTPTAMPTIVIVAKPPLSASGSRCAGSLCAGSLCAGSRCGIALCGIGCRNFALQQPTERSVRLPKRIFCISVVHCVSHQGSKLCHIRIAVPAVKGLPPHRWEPKNTSVGPNASRLCTFPLETSFLRCCSTFLLGRSYSTIWTLTMA